MELLLLIVCHFVAPRAVDISLYDPGTAFIESSDMVMIVGRIIIASMIDAAINENPVVLNVVLINGTTTTSAKKPYITDGIAASV